VSLDVLFESLPFKSVCVPQIKPINIIEQSEQLSDFFEELYKESNFNFIRSLTLKLEFLIMLTLAPKRIYF